MATCGIPMLDQRSCRVDVASTVGAPVSWQIDFGQDVSGWTFTAGLFGPDGQPAVRDDMTDLPGLDVSDAASGIVELTVTGAQSEEEPLGTGTWTWWLAAVVPPATEPTSVVGGSLILSPPWVFAPDCDAGSSVTVPSSVGDLTVGWS